MCRVSIIIPVYNVQKYLNRCLESLIIQITSEDEIILIDDQSTDNSEEICRQYENNYKNIFYHKLEKNEGPSRARNYGLKKAKGKYIIFLDSDDFIENNYIETMVKNIQNHDLVICGYNMVNEVKEEKLEIKMATQKISSENIVNLLKNKNMLNTLWNKIYKLEIIKKNKITFDEKENRGEDLLFNLDYIACVKNNIYIIEDVLYNYIMKKTGLNLRIEETLEKRLKRAKKVANKMKKIKNNGEIKKLIFKTYILHIYIFIRKKIAKIIKFRTKNGRNK